MSPVNAVTKWRGRRSNQGAPAGAPQARPRRDSVVFRLAGIAFAGSGAAHFVAPKLFIVISRAFFPDNTAKWVQVNGASEFAIGLAIAKRRTRIVGAIGLVAYLIYLGDRVIAYGTRSRRE